MSLLSIFQAGARLIDGTVLNKALAYPTLAYASGLKATSGGTVTTSIAITESISEFDTVVTGGAGATLPYPTPGASFTVINQGGYTLTIFSAANAAGVASSIVNAAGSTVAGATGVSLATVRVTDFFCAKAGLWVMSLAAAS